MFGQMKNILVIVVFFGIVAWSLTPAYALHESAPQAPSAPEVSGEVTP